MAIILIENLTNVNLEEMKDIKIIDCRDDIAINIEQNQSKDLVVLVRSVKSFLSHHAEIKKSVKLILTDREITFPNQAVSNPL